MRVVYNFLRVALVACALFMPTRAAACGGLFCNVRPVEQTGEQIAFVYEPDGTVSTVVQIRYQGSAEDFAWVLPVPAAPEVGLGTAAFFTALGRSTRPTRRVIGGVDGVCRDWACDQGPCGPGTLCFEDTSDPGVEVDSQAELGPYEVAVLSADDPGALRRWLDDNGYRVSPGAADVLAEYVDTGHHFVALRLRQDVSVGEIQPIVVRSASTEPCIPLRLTSIAAVEDMEVTVYVLADRRARPWSWLLVDLDLSDVDFWQGTVSYQEMVTRTVDAAGGQAFVTDYAGPMPGWRVAPLVTEAELAAVRSYRALLTALGPLAMDPVAQRVVQRNFRREGRLDAVAIARELEVAVLAPRRDAQRMIDSHAWLTRMSTTVSPWEMTTDPTFSLSDELPPQQSNRLRATRVSECSAAYDRIDAPTHLRLDDGTTVPWSAGRLVEESSCRQAFRLGGGGGGCSVTRGRAGGWWAALWLLALVLGVVRR